MTMSIAAGAKPAFLYPNRFNRHADRAADLAVSTGTTLRHRLYDNDPRAQYTSAGANNDATAEVITSGLWLPGMQNAFDIDYWAILNHNLDTLTLELSEDGGATYDTEYNASGIAVANSRGVLSATKAVDKFRITGTVTQTADQEKLIGAVYLSGLRFQAANRMFTYRPEPPRVEHKTAQMADGSIRSAPVFRSDASFHFYAASVAFVVDTAAELANFRALLNDPDPFLFMPYPGDRADDIWLCRIRPGTYNDAPYLKSQPDVRLVEFVAEEVGA